MANPKPPRDPDIAEKGRATRFGQPGGPDPSKIRGGDKAWSIRNQLRYIAAQRIDITQPDALEQLFGENPTIAQRAAFNALLKTAKEEGDLRAIEFADERIDGKLPQTTINADWENLKNMSDDELRAVITAGFTEIDATGRGDSGGQAPRAKAAKAKAAKATDPAS